MFEVVSKFKDKDIKVPTRATKNSAGYDLYVAEDTIIPPIEHYYEVIAASYPLTGAKTLEEVTNIISKCKCKLPLVSTGVKCKLAEDEYLQLQMRSSIPLKTFMIMGNAPGIIDSDYYNNPDNEGEIFVQIMNLSPFVIELKKGDKIAQGIILKYNKVENDCTDIERTGGFGSTGK